MREKYHRIVRSLELEKTMNSHESTEQLSPTEPMVHNPKNEIGVGMFFGVWCIVGWWSLLNTSELWQDDYDLDAGPGLLPKLILGILSFGALSLLVKGLFGLRQQILPPIMWGSLLRSALVPMSLILVLLVFPLVIQWIGFIPAGTFFALGWMSYLGIRDGQAITSSFWVKNMLGTAFGVGLIYFVFIFLIGVPLR